MFVEDYMSREPITIEESAPLADAAALMVKQQFRQLPVLDEGARLSGIITDRDIRETVGFGEPLRDNLVVSDLMTANPVTISLDATMDDVVRVLAENRFGSLPVVWADRLVGIITYMDVLRAFSEVFGLDKPGKRIEVALPGGYADLSRAFGALKSCNGTVLAAVISRTRRDGGEPALYLRVEHNQARNIEKRLRDATLILLEPEHT